MSNIKIGIIGGGAAGFFAAITAKEANPEAEVVLLEKTSKVLSKVKISGGGRCNVTNATYEIYSLIKHYPRGSKELKKAFSIFSVKDTIQWFESRNVRLKTEPDGRMFPVTDSSQTVIDCLLGNCNLAGIKVRLGTSVTSVILNSSGKLELGSENGTEVFDKVLIATGGNPKYESYRWLENLGHIVEIPVPSLFTFNIPDSKYEGLQGVAVNDAVIRIAGSKSSQQGPVLITHWGLSGPAVLRLSAWEARTFQQVNYNFAILINWVPDKEEESLRTELQNLKSGYPKKIVRSNPLFNLPRRLWERLVEISDIPSDLKWGDMANKSINKLIEELLRSSLSVKGKTTFKEEFVTCGGVSLKDIRIETMESLKIPGLYFAGEVLNIDGITGGFNFQAAWTTGYIAGKAMASNF